MNSFRTIELKDDHIIMLDQRKLPEKEDYLKLYNHYQVAEAIKKMVIRGAPAIGVAASMGIAICASTLKIKDKKEFIKRVEEACDLLSTTRPTAVNLFWAIERMKRVLKDNIKEDIDTIKTKLRDEAQKIYKEDLETCKKIGEYGSTLIEENYTILTHCNAGALATAGYGTALGVIRSAHNQGKRIQVIACETRPFLQGARLTAWELKKENIPVTLITDNMVGHVISEGMIDCVIVGADRIALNGDVANKIGTYTISIVAKNHNVPFYVAAPISTIDFNCPNGKEIPIEKRNPEEVTHLGKQRIAPDVEVYNPAFDITPAKNVSCIITEIGIIEQPYSETILKFKDYKPPFSSSS